MQDKRAIVSLSGNLDYFNIYDILMLLHLGRKTGVLTIENQEEKRQIFMHQGIIVFAISSDYRDSLAKYMVENNFISSEMLNKGYRIMKQNPDKYKSPWDILVEKDLLNERVLKGAAEDNISQLIYSLFRWKNGIFQFSNFGRLPEHAIIVNIDPQTLVMEGVRMSDEWEEIHKDSPKEDIILQVNPDIDPNSQKLDLTDVEWKILGKVNGNRSVLDICKEAKYLNEYETLKILTELYKKKIILPSEKRVEDVDNPDIGESSSSISIFSLETLHAGSRNRKKSEKVADEGKTEKKPSEDMEKLITSQAVLRGKIVITEKGVKTRTLIITGEPMIIGSSNDCDVPVQTESFDVPLRYATIYLEGMSYYIRSNGEKMILINNQEYLEKELERFDEIQIGDFSIIFS